MSYHKFMHITLRDQLTNRRLENPGISCTSVSCHRFLHQALEGLNPETTLVWSPRGWVVKRGIPEDGWNFMEFPTVSKEFFAFGNHFGLKPQNPRMDRMDHNVGSANGRNFHCYWDPVISILCQGLLAFQWIWLYALKPKNLRFTLTETSIAPENGWLEY